LIDLDQDSTVKEANITYPTDAKNLKTLMLMIYRCLDYFSKNGFKKETVFALKFDLTKALSDFRKYFFTKDKDEKMAILAALSKRVSILIENSLAAFEAIDMPKIKWYIVKKLKKIEKYASVYIKQVKHYCRTGRASKNKILSFHQENVAAIAKGKEHIKYEFGQTWQVGCFDGNFVFGKFSPSDLMYSDASAVKDMLKEVMNNENIDDPSFLETFGADRGYCSSENFESLEAVGIEQQGIHPKGKGDWRITEKEDATYFINRRAGIEPIIGHLKRLGLGKSRMKTDIGTIAEGARSFIAFNIRKILFGLALI